MEFLKMPLMSSIDIDCEEEFQLAELIMRERLS
jgi:CMP-N-acetylneuraminic acid synthetase